MTEPARRRTHRRATGGTASPASSGVPDADEADRSVLPTRSADDSDHGWGERPAGSDDDERFLREVPPHW